jgi:non-specific serine/threonine protein kinase
MVSTAPSRVRQRHNLPAERTSFVGRERALAQLRRLVGGDRLLTISGPGGCGKTRTALRLAAALADRYPDGVWLAELAALTDAADVPRAVAAALGVEEQDGAAGAALIAALAGKRLLLLLDNCEHLLDGCAALADRLLRACSGLQIIATSREPLRVAGEVVWMLPPLALPASSEQDPDSLRENEAVRLFLDRARARLPEFALSVENAPAVSAICRRLDGIPLAVELAASLVADFSVSELAVLLDQALPLLTRGRRSDTRHGTLRDTFAWSHALLSDAERTLFRRLAVFRGGWDLAAAVAVCSGDALASASVPGVLAALVEKSLVLAASEDGRGRYWLLEPLRQYALELLEASGELDARYLRHLQHYTTWAESLKPRTLSAERGPALALLARENDNIRAALGWALPSAGEPPAECAALALRLTGALFGYWHFRGSRSEGLRWLERALRWRDDRADATAAWVLYAAGDMAWLMGEYAHARAWLVESVRLGRTLDEPRGLAYALQAYACASDAPLAERWAAMDESIALFHQQDDPWGEALARGSAGFLALMEGDSAAARARMLDAVERFAALGDDWFAAQLLNQAGDIAREERRYAEAATLYARGLTLLERCEDSAAVLPSVIANLGFVALRRRETRRALQLLRRALALFRDRGDQRGVAECLAGVAGALAAMRQFDRAARLCGATEASLARSGAELWPANRAAYEQDRAALCAAMGEQSFARGFTAGERLSVVAAIAEALPRRQPAEPRADERSSVAPSYGELTAREREVVVLLARGCSNREIAAALVISTGTAGLHVKHILHKLGCTSRAQAAAWAVANGLDR